MKSTLKYLLSSVFVLGINVQAQVYFDHEIDSIPLFSLQIVLPQGSELEDSAQSGFPILLDEILSDGTKRLDRQNFLDALSTYGANLEFEVSNFYSTWSLSFPFIQGKDYSGLVKLLEENWKTPRFTDAAFKNSFTKYVAGLKSSVDSDGAMASSFPRRYLSTHYFGLSPFLIEKTEKASLAQVKDLYQKYFLNPSRLWVGLVAPSETRIIAENILKTLFPQASQKFEGPLNEMLQPNVIRRLKVKEKQHFLLLVNKSNRTQTEMGNFYLHLGELSEKGRFEMGVKNEVTLDFANFISEGSGLGSIWGEVMRTKGGFAYAVGGAGYSYLGLPMFGVRSNPMVNRIEEALGAVEKTDQNLYQNGTLLRSIGPDRFEKAWKSFKYTQILGQSTPDGRLGRRKAVALGSMHPDLLKNELENYKPSPAELEAAYQKWIGASVKATTLVGDAQKLGALAKNLWPNAKTIIIEYKDTISAKKILEAK